MFFEVFGGSSKDVSIQTDLIYIDKSVGPDADKDNITHTPTPIVKKKVKYNLINIYLKLNELYENIQNLKNSLIISPSDLPMLPAKVPSDLPMLPAKVP